MTRQNDERKATADGMPEKIENANDEVGLNALYFECATVGRKMDNRFRVSCKADLKKKNLTQEQFNVLSNKRTELRQCVESFLFAKQNI